MPSQRLGEIEIHYQIRGVGPPVLLVPGLSLDLHVFDAVVDRLEDRCTCVALDNRGAGRSDAPRGPYSMRDLAGDLFGLLTVLGVERAVVVGHSMGGYAALQLALDSPEVVAGLVLLSSSPTGRPRELGSSPEAAAALARTRGSLESIVRGNASASFGGRFRAERPDDFDRFVAARLEHPPRGRGVAGQRAAARGFDVRDRLWEVTCPAVVVHGADDRLVAPARGEELAAGIGGARLVRLQRVGHMPQVEAADATAEAILSVVDRAG